MSNRDIFNFIKMIASCLTAAFLIFFISALSGEDLIKNSQNVKELDSILKFIFGHGLNINRFNNNRVASYWYRNIFIL